MLTRITQIVALQPLTTRHTIPKHPMITTAKSSLSALLAITLLVAAMPTHAQSVTGAAKALDGDSLEVEGRQVRLLGIDAPEFDQTCTKQGSQWPCGQVAKEQLSALIAGQRVECRGQGVDQYGRILAVCSIGYDELNRTMVEQGWAVAYRTYTDAYVPAELRAKSQKLGIWASTFTMPEDYRIAKLPPEPPAVSRPRRQAPRQTYQSPGGCVIKGNRNRRGQWIYHLPGMPYYDQTRPEDIFCTEAEARAAGYRRAIVRP